MQLGHGRCPRPKPTTDRRKDRTTLGSLLPTGASCQCRLAEGIGEHRDQFRHLGQVHPGGGHAHVVTPVTEHKRSLIERATSPSALRQNLGRRESKGACWEPFPPLDYPAIGMLCRVASPWSQVDAYVPENPDAIEATLGGARMSLSAGSVLSPDPESGTQQAAALLRAW